MKQAVKALLPSSVIALYEDAIDRRNLESVPLRIFRASNLRPLTDPQVKQFLCDSAIQTFWEEDHSRISRIFGEAGPSRGVNPGDRRAIYSLIMGLKPTSVLEVGTNVGASTLYIAAALNRASRGELHTVDIVDVNDSRNAPWREARTSDSPRNLLRKLNLLSYVQFETSDSIAFMRSTDLRFDFIFLDGDHGGRTVYEELSEALRLLNPGGTVLLHDYYPGEKVLFPGSTKTIAGPYRAMKRVQSENAGIEVLPLGKLPWQTRIGTDVTSLALVAARYSH
jgi:predicted O-methyltransferase YrrM